MSADTFEALSYHEPAVYGRAGAHEIVRSFTVDLDDLVGAAGGGAKPLEANDVIKFFKVPPDVRFTYGRIDVEALDNATSSTIDLLVTNGTTTKYFINASTIGRSSAAGFGTTDDAAASGVVSAVGSNPAIGFVTDNDNYYVAVKCSAAPAGDGGGDNIHVMVKYISNLESGQPAFRT